MENPLIYNIDYQTHSAKKKKLPHSKEIYLNTNSMDQMHQIKI